MLSGPWRCPGGQCLVSSRHTPCAEAVFEASAHGVCRLLKASARGACRLLKASAHGVCRLLTDLIALTRYRFPPSEATMPLTVRTATPADVPVVAEFNRRLARESEHFELDLATVIAGVAAAIADPAGKGPYYLACDGDEIVGQCQTTFEWSDWRNGWFWWIQSVYTRADHRGRGVYRTLYEHVRAAARRAGNVQ